MAHRVIPLTPPLFFHFTLPLIQFCFRERRLLSGPDGVGSTNREGERPRGHSSLSALQGECQQVSLVN